MQGLLFKPTLWTRKLFHLTTGFWTGKGQFEETQHEHDVLANALLLTYQKK